MKDGIIVRVRSSVRKEVGGFTAEDVSRETTVTIKFAGSAAGRLTKEDKDDLAHRVSDTIVAALSK
jgi:hypothetical protein